MVNHNIQVSFILLIETTGDKHHEERIFGETFPTYPSYREGDKLYLRMIQKGEIDSPLKLTGFEIVGIHHLLSSKKHGTGRFAIVTSTVGMDVYLRKID
jgi:hypothetical protein